MEKQIIKNLFSQKDLSEENLKEFLDKKSEALKKAEENKKKFEETYQALFDVGLIENEHFTIEGTQVIFELEVELDMFQDDENGLYTQYSFQTKLPCFNARFKFIQHRVEEHKYDENSVPLKPYINKDSLSASVKYDSSWKNGEYVHTPKIDCYSISNKEIKIKTFAERYFEKESTIQERLNNAIFKWKKGLAKYSKAYKYAKDDRFIEFKKSINDILKRTNLKLFVAYQTNEYDYINFSIKERTYSDRLVHFSILIDNTLATRLRSISIDTDKSFAKSIIDLVYKYTQEEVVELEEV